jgi:hypothetical protein
VRVARGNRPAPLLLLGTVRGLESETAQVEEELGSFAPEIVALGLSPEEVRALQDHFSDPGTEPWVPLSPSEVAYAQGLCYFGNVRVPSPAFVAAMRWAARAQARVEGVEPGDDRYSELFLEHVGYFDLLRRTLAERSLVRSPPTATDPETFATDWETRSQAGRGSAALGAARAQHLGERLRDLHRPSGASLKSRVALLVDVERFPAVLSELRDGAWKDLKALPREAPTPARGDASKGGETSDA